MVSAAKIYAFVQTGLIPFGIGAGRFPSSPNPKNACTSKVENAYFLQLYTESTKDMNTSLW